MKNLTKNDRMKNFELYEKDKDMIRIVWEIQLELDRCSYKEINQMDNWFDLIEKKFLWKYELYELCKIQRSLLKDWDMRWAWQENEQMRRTDLQQGTQ